MGALLKILELNILLIASFIFKQTVKKTGQVILLCTMHKDKERKDVIDVLKKL
jgi:hypothetical protein